VFEQGADLFEFAKDLVSLFAGDGIVSASEGCRYGDQQNEWPHVFLPSVKKFVSRQNLKKFRAALATANEKHRELR
jgi:hypothetical protein